MPEFARQLLPTQGVAGLGTQPKAALSHEVDLTRPAAQQQIRARVALEPPLLRTRTKFLQQAAAQSQAAFLQSRLRKGAERSSNYSLENGAPSRAISDNFGCSDNHKVQGPCIWGNSNSAPFLGRATCFPKLQRPRDTESHVVARHLQAFKTRFVTSCNNCVKLAVAPCVSTPRTKIS